jgi:hypothetical protein
VNHHISIFFLYYTCANRRFIIFYFIGINRLTFCNIFILVFCVVYNLLFILCRHVLQLDSCDTKNCEFYFIIFIIDCAETTIIILLLYFTFIGRSVCRACEVFWLPGRAYYIIRIYNYYHIIILLVLCSRPVQFVLQFFPKNSLTFLMIQ